MQNSVEALLDRLGRLDRDLLGQIPKLPVLGRSSFDGPASVLGGEVHEIRKRSRISELGDEIQRGGGPGVGYFDDLGSVLGGMLGMGRTGFVESAGNFLGSYLHLLEICLGPRGDRLGEIAENSLDVEKGYVELELCTSVGHFIQRSRTRFGFHIGITHGLSSFQAKLDNGLKIPRYVQMLAAPGHQCSYFHVGGMPLRMRRSRSLPEPNYGQRLWKLRFAFRLCA